MLSLWAKKMFWNMATHNLLGKEGEEAACRYLLSHDYTIRHRNWRSGHKELDIVALKEDTLVIVEVKTRSTTYFGDPEEAVDWAKIRHIVQSADAYVRQFAIDLPVRFDVMEVTGSEPPLHVEHIPDAFYPPVG
jgi:putative endonuclease